MVHFQLQDTSGVRVGQPEQVTTTSTCRYKKLHIHVTIKMYAYVASPGDAVL